MTTYTSCKACTSRRDCWILRSVIELRTRGDPDSPTYELVLKASRGECPLYIDKDESVKGNKNVQEKGRSE